MGLTKVTITGADDSTDIAELIELSREFPFVEWGILVSKKQNGDWGSRASRFPSRTWCDKFTAMVSNVSGRINVSTHVCGEWVRQLLVGAINWDELPSVINVCQRIQINTHAIPHASNFGIAASLAQKRARHFIFQWDGVNDNLVFAANLYGFNSAALFDTSGGAGALPGSWPAPPTDAIPFGYAGGLSDENVVEQLENIQAVCSRPFWIDMERRVRTEDDSALDMQRVRKVLELCKPYIAAK